MLVYGYKELFHVLNVHKDIAAEQAKIVGEALKSARIDIVGGDNNFFNRLVNSITTGKQVDRMVENSDVLADFKGALLGDDHEQTKLQISEFVSKFGLSSDDVKNLTISALMMKMLSMADKDKKGVLNGILDSVKQLGIGDMPAHEIVDWTASKSN